MAVNICGACQRGDHAACDIVPVAMDRHTKEALTTAAGFFDCRCLCDPTMTRVQEILTRGVEALKRRKPKSAMFHVMAARTLLRAQLGKEKK